MDPVIFGEGLASAMTLVDPEHYRDLQHDLCFLFSTAFGTGGSFGIGEAFLIRNSSRCIWSGSICVLVSM